MTTDLEIDVRSRPITAFKAAAVDQPTWLERLGRRALLARLQKLEHGKITLVEEDAIHTFGRQTQTCSLHASLVVHRPQFFRRAAFGGDVGAAEAFMDGDWSCDNLTDLIRILVVNSQTQAARPSRLAWLAEPLRHLGHWFNRNTKSGSRRNISAHYDLGNDFFQLFLDETLMYSCGVFERPESTLLEASIAKNERICRKLQLSPDDHLLEIGTGWGGFALYAAKNFGCRITTTTISREQYEFAVQRITDAGLQDRVTVLLQDYRDLTGEYDKLVSIEMIEAVGDEFLRQIFRDMQPPAQTERPDGAARDHDCRPALRGLHPASRFHSEVHLPRWLPAVGDSHWRVDHARDRSAVVPPRRLRAALRENAQVLARPLPRTARRSTGTRLR